MEFSRNSTTTNVLLIWSCTRNCIYYLSQPKAL